MKLYYNPQSRAMIAKWLLDEAGVDYEVVHIDFQKGEHKTPQFLAINPAGKLPALVDGPTKIFENPAICLYIADKFPAARLAPAIDSVERGRYLSLLIYSTAQLEPAMGDAILKLPTAPQRGWADYETCKSLIERELGTGPYLFGDWFTAADIMIGSMFIWQRMLGTSTGRPKLEAYVERLLKRPKGLKLPAPAGQ
jgi:glutathione S-transferase